MDVFNIFLMLCLASTASSIRLDADKSHNFNVVKYGAVGDGRTDDTKAFQKTWKAFCGATTSKTPVFIIPPGKTFLLKPVEFWGPCKSPKLFIKVAGTIVAPNKISDYNGYETDKWLAFEYVDGLVLYGEGQIDGRGSTWWLGDCEGDNRKDKRCKRPTALLFHKCNGLILSGLKHVNSQKNHISINGCKGVTVSHISITAPEDSPNTDGIDISQSTNVKIQNSFIGTGDDCVAINGGSSYINITNVNCGPGHGISVGSLGKDGTRDTVEEVRVQHCNFVGTQNGARIKTWQGGSGYARKISFRKIKLTNVENPIIIDQYYCGGAHDCSNQTSAVKVSDVTFAGIRGTSATEETINLSCSQTVGCTNILLKNVKIRAAVPGKKLYSYCLNAHGTCKGSSPPVDCLK